MNCFIYIVALVTQLTATISSPLVPTVNEGEYVQYRNNELMSLDHENEVFSIYRCRDIYAESAVWEQLPLDFQEPKFGFYTLYADASVTTTLFLGAFGVKLYNDAGHTDPLWTYPIYKSNDDGETWRGIDSPAFYENVPGYPPRYDITIRDIVIDPGNSQKVYAVGNGTWVSSDGGEHWEVLNVGVAMDRIKIHPKYPEVMVGYNNVGGIYSMLSVSNNYGKYWSSPSFYQVIPEREYYPPELIYDIELDPYSKSAFYCVGDLVTCFTEDYGETFRPFVWTDEGYDESFSESKYGYYGRIFSLYDRHGHILIWAGMDRIHELFQYGTVWGDKVEVGELSEAENNARLLFRDKFHPSRFFVEIDGYLHTVTIEGLSTGSEHWECYQ